MKTGKFGLDLTNKSLNIHVDDKGKVTHLTQG
jgi:hypothetical protein